MCPRSWKPTMYHAESISAESKLKGGREAGGEAVQQVGRPQHEPAPAWGPAPAPQLCEEDWEDEGEGERRPWGLGRGRKGGVKPSSLGLPLCTPSIWGWINAVGSCSLGGSAMVEAGLAMPQHLLGLWPRSAEGEMLSWLESWTVMRLLCREHLLARITRH